MTPQEQLANLNDFCIKLLQSYKPDKHSASTCFDQFIATPEGSKLIAKIGQQGGETEEDAFIKKHMNIIMDKMADAQIVNIIEKMWGGLEMASVQHFMETGKVNGSLHTRLKELMMKFAAQWGRRAADESPESSPTEASVKELMGKSWDAAMFYNENTGGPADDFVPNKEEAIKMLYGKGSPTQAGEGVCPYCGSGNIHNLEKSSHCRDCKKMFNVSL